MIDLDAQLQALAAEHGARVLFAGVRVHETGELAMGALVVIYQGHLVFVHAPAYKDQLQVGSIALLVYNRIKAEFLAKLAALPACDTSPSLPPSPSSSR